MKQLLLDIQPAALPTLDNFIVGRNAEALHSLQQALAGHTAMRFIYLWGAAGSGKTHLLTACNTLAQQAHTTLIIADAVHLLTDEDQIALFDTYNQLRASEGILIASGNA